MRDRLRLAGLRPEALRVTRAAWSVGAAGRRVGAWKRTSVRNAWSGSAADAFLAHLRFHAYTHPLPEQGFICGIGMTGVGAAWYNGGQSIADFEGQPLF